MADGNKNNAVFFGVCDRLGRGNKLAVFFIRLVWFLLCCVLVGILLYLIFAIIFIIV